MSKHVNEAADQEAYERTMRIRGSVPAGRPHRSDKRCAVCDRSDIVGGPRMIESPQGETLCSECAK